MVSSCPIVSRFGIACYHLIDSATFESQSRNCGDRRRIADCSDGHSRRHQEKEKRKAEEWGYWENEEEVPLAQEKGGQGKHGRGSLTCSVASTPDD